MALNLLSVTASTLRSVPSVFLLLGCTSTGPRPLSVVYLFVYPSNELSFFQLIVIVRSYVVLLHHCPRLGGRWDPAYMFNSTKFCMYVSVPSQEPVIQWLSFVDELHISFFVHFFYINEAVSFLVWIVLHFKAEYAVWALIIVEGRTVTLSCWFLCHLVSWWELSHWQSYHSFFFILSTCFVFVSRLLFRLHMSPISWVQFRVSTTWKTIQFYHYNLLSKYHWWIRSNYVEFISASFNILKSVKCFNYKRLTLFLP